MSKDDSDGIRVSETEFGDEKLIVVSVPVSEDIPDILTPTERNICKLVTEGLTNQEIADHRGTSVRTVANQIGSIFRKVKVNNRAALVRLLVDAELE